MDNEGPQQRTALEHALVHALHALTATEFGAALQEVMQATGRTQGDIIRRDSHTEKKWLSKSTVSRMVNGTTIGRHREQVEAFIRGCGGVDAYAEMWGFAWLQVRAATRADRTTTTDQDAGAPVDAELVNETPAGTDPAHHSQHPSTADGAETPAADVSAGDCPLTEDALLDIHVRVTKEHLSKAAPVLVAMGLLTATNGHLPTGRELVVMALLGAAGIALLSHMQRIAQTDNDAIPQPTATSITAMESLGVYVTAPRTRVT